MVLDFLSGVVRLAVRFRYPVSLPEQVADALGMELSNFLSYQGIVKRLSSPYCRAERLHRYMGREDAEALFKSAVRKERFQRKTLFSYYFRSGWLEFVLEFDDLGRLRRLYMLHGGLPLKDTSGVEIAIAQPSASKSSSSSSFSLGCK